MRARQGALGAARWSGAPAAAASAGHAARGGVLTGAAAASGATMSPGDRELRADSSIDERGRSTGSASSLGCSADGGSGLDAPSSGFGGDHVSDACAGAKADASNVFIGSGASEGEVGQSQGAFSASCFSGRLRAASMTLSRALHTALAARRFRRCCFCRRSWMRQASPIASTPSSVVPTNPSHVRTPKPEGVAVSAVAT